MKNRKLYLYLLLTYVAMQIGSIFIGKQMVTYLHDTLGLSEQDAKYHGVAWTLFIVNTIAAVIFILLPLKNKNFWTVFKGKKSSIGGAILWGVIGFFLAMGGQMIAAIIEMALGITPGSENTAVLSEIAKISPIIIICIAIYAPLLEEIVFRRIIFGGMYTITNFWIAAVVSAIVFAAVHNEFEHILLYLMPGLVFSFLYYKTKRLLAPMISHCLMNSFVIIVQLNYDKLQKLQELKPSIIFFLQ